MQNHTPQCDLRRVLNCKSFEFQDYESYPQIRPPVSRCCVEKKVDKDCGSRFDKKVDAIMDVWQRSLQNESLSYYGVNSEKQNPKAKAFNKAVAKCLSKVSVQKKKVTKLTKTAKPNLPKKCRGNDVLNQQLLQAKVSQMPNIHKFLHPSNAPNCLKRSHRMESTSDE